MDNARTEMKREHRPPPPGTVPFAWRALAALSYVSWSLGAGLITPLAVWFAYRNSFLRTHALNALVIHACGTLIAGILYFVNFALIKETQMSFLSYFSYVGLYLADPTETLQWIMLLSVIFLFWITRIGVRLGSLPPRPFYPTPRLLFLFAWLAILLPPFLLYNNILWPTPGARTVRLLDFGRFRDPLLLFPGHAVVLFTFFFAFVALAGKRTRLFIPALYMRLLRDERKKGVAKEEAALLRARLLPGWGQMFSGRLLSGLAAFTVFFLLLFFFAVSLSLNYGRLAEDIPGLNANAAWYFMSELGLRSHVPDKIFKGLLGNGMSLGLLGLSLFFCYLYSTRATRAIYGPASDRRFKYFLPFSFLLHMTPIAVLLVIPVSFITNTPKKTKGEPFYVIPEFFELPEKRMKLNGSFFSGDRAKTYGKKQGKTARPTRAKSRPGRTAYRKGRKKKPGEGRPDPRLLIDERRGKDARGGRPGKRAEMTYSNYLSAKIRGPLKSFDYWRRIPEQYSTVLQFKISSTGEIYDIRILEPSRHHASDRLTRELVKALGVILPPPGGAHVVVTELFWNTTPGDDTLPTLLQRRLSRVFDGRVIERL